jgi:hypothetical protein
LLEIGHEGWSEAFIAYLLPKVFIFRYAAVRSDVSCSWEIELNDFDNEPDVCPRAQGRYPDWVAASNGQIPSNAVLGGFHNGDLYIARARHMRSLTPGHVKANSNCVISWGGQAHCKDNYEVLCGGNGRFLQCDDGDIPDNAYEAGTSEDGESMFIGRVNHQGSLLLGKVQPSHDVLYVPFQGYEQSFHSYEVFVVE